jgi:hypothetical protein
MFLGSGIRRQAPVAHREEPIGCGELQHEHATASHVLAGFHLVWSGCGKVLHVQGVTDHASLL